MSASGLRRTAAGAVSAIAVLAAAASADAAGTPVPITKLGTVDVREAAAHPQRAPRRLSQLETPVAQALGRLEERRHEAGEGEERSAAAALEEPAVPGSPVTSNENQQGWEGLDIRDTFFSQGTEVEPPDPALCGGTFNGVKYLWQETNLAIALFDTQQNQYTPPALGLNELYGLDPIFNFETGEFGPFISDPKCYFDTATRRWFHSVLEIDVDPETGNFGEGANTLLAVSESADPFGPYNVYAIDATVPGCNLCIGDQPLLGADANAIFLSTAEYDLAPPQGDFAFFGAQIYAIDKRALVNGSDNPRVVHIETGSQNTGTLQPATTPSGRFATAQLGTEYFLSAQDCEQPDCGVDPESLENTIGIWAVTRTATIRNATPSLKLLHKQIPSQVYGTPLPQSQRDGFRPLGQSLGEGNPEIEANDARMNQVVYAAGRLWGGVNTRVSGDRDGIAWFQVTPAVFSTRVNGAIARQGYIAADQDHTFLTFPAIGVNDLGKGVVAYSFMGDAYYPSAGQTPIDKTGTKGGVQIVRHGFKPEDGFTCYPQFGGEKCRWGDYNTSFAFPSGEIWSTAEMIGDNARTQFANWSTFVWPYRP